MDHRFAPQIESLVGQLALVSQPDSRNWKVWRQAALDVLPSDVADVEAFVKELTHKSRDAALAVDADFERLCDTHPGLWPAFNEVTQLATARLIDGGAHGNWEACIEVVYGWVNDVFPADTVNEVCQHRYSNENELRGNPDQFLYAGVRNCLGDLYYTCCPDDCCAESAQA